MRKKAGNVEGGEIRVVVRTVEEYTGACNGKRRDVRDGPVWISHQLTHPAPVSLLLTFQDAVILNG